MDGISDEDLLSGRYDNAEVFFMLFNYEDLSMGVVKLPSSGRVGQVTLGRGSYTAELRSKASFLQEKIDERYSKVCRAELGDFEDDRRRPTFGCKVRLDPLPWQPLTNYTVRPAQDAAAGSVVKPTSYNGRHFQNITAGISGATEPAWQLGLGATTIDGSAEWKTIEALTKYGSVFAALDRKRFTDADRDEMPTEGLGDVTALFQMVAVNPPGHPHTFRVAGNLVDQFTVNAKMTVVNSSGNDGDYIVQSSSLNGADTDIGVPDVPSPTADGQVVGRLAATVGFFNHGKLTFFSGANTGIAREVRNFAVTSYRIVAVNQGTPSFSVAGDQTAFFAVNQRFSIKQSTGNDQNFDLVSAVYDGTTNTIISVAQAIPDATADGAILAGPGFFEMFEAFPFDIAPGDEYEVTAGCDQSLAMCTKKFDNVDNRQAEDNIPGTDSVLLYPDAK
jgi:hypothetical protein